MCGGTQSWRDSKPSVKGLSPRVRGNPIAAPAFILRTRSIPACAGEPCSTELTRCSARVYPRVCGGTPAARTLETIRSGLSPRVRGNRRSARAGTSTTGSIPACAGEPVDVRQVRLVIGVYPRVCGGTILVVFSDRHHLGLSPRVRGNPILKASRRKYSGSIPACAGEPRTNKPLRPLIMVYPRVCGGTAQVNAWFRTGLGLSPRVRGNLVALVDPLDSLGSIPACAGEPEAHGIARRVFKVYPRVCGGTPTLQDMLRRSNGLSPRVRGNLVTPCC